MYSVLMTVKSCGINPRTWLSSYLQACADNGNRAPDGPTPFLPWAMDKKRLTMMKAVLADSVTIDDEENDSS